MTTNIPIPDPSTLTTAQLLREMGWLDRITQVELRAAEKIADIRWSASKEAVQKAETAAIKQMDALGAALNAGLAAQLDKIQDMGQRLNRGEGGQSGKSSQATLLISIGALAIAFVTMAVLLFRAHP